MNTPTNLFSQQRQDFLRRSLKKKRKIQSFQKTQEESFKFRTLSLGSYKMFFTIENNQLVYKFI